MHRCERSSRSDGNRTTTSGSGLPLLIAAVAAAALGFPELRAEEPAQAKSTVASPKASAVTASEAAGSGGDAPKSSAPKSSRPTATDLQARYLFESLAARLNPLKVSLNPGRYLNPPPLVETAETRKFSTPRAGQPTAAELQARYPFESLADRLKPLKASLTAARSLNPPRLGETAETRLLVIEQSLSSDGRTLSLEKLHSSEVEKFISRGGFGLSRLVDSPSPGYLEYPESPQLTFAERPPQSAGDHAPVPLVLPERGWREEPGRGWTPSLEMLVDFHMLDEWLFIHSRSLGFVDPARGVAGFRAHGFRSLPELTHPDNQHARQGDPLRSERWRIGRVELVSLLKSEKPAVYVSEHLPRMLDLKDARTRTLTAFENQSLTRLTEGEEVVSEATLNEIQMFGALRAAKQCLDCHTGQRGQLLGAFSYRLFRDPPLKAIEPPRS